MDKISNDCDRVTKKIESIGESKSELKKPNESLDSGIAGLKDPHYVNTNNNEHTSGSNDNESGDERYVLDTTNHTTYMKGKFLGKGGFARVHELLDTSSNVVYAGKIIPKTRITKRQHLEKIAREILIHRGLVHHNVVRLHHFFEDSVNAYIILENCPRKSLVHVLRHRLTVTEPEVRYYLKQLVNGVKYIHSQNVIHRDLKPGNMLLTEEMVVKVGDFGLATLENGDTRVTICGTPNYIAPEVLNKLSYSFEADVWAIGCIMFTLLAGQPPFETNSLRETYSRILANKYSLPTLASDQAKDLLFELLSPSPKERPSLDGILDSLFLRGGFAPKVLSPSCCYSTPNFHHTSNSMPTNNNCSSPRSSEAGEAFSNDLKPNATSLKMALNVVPVEQSRTPLLERLSPNGLPPALAPSPTPMPRLSSLKQRLGRVLCTDTISLCRSGKRGSNAANLYKTLGSTLCMMPNSQRVAFNPPVVECSPLCVSKWIDYSNKYGFGFQLSDKSVGVLFNDNTRIAFTPDRSRVEFHDVHGVVSAHPQHSVPALLGDRLTLLRYFGNYMDEHLTEGADVKPLACQNKSTVPHMKRWVRTNTAMIMELSNGTLQINFFKDHTKVIISRSKQGYLVTYINSERQSRSYLLQNISVSGCDSGIYERLRFATAVVYEFAVLEGGI